MTARRDEVATRFMALQTQIIGDVARAALGYQSMHKRLKETNDLLQLQARRKEDVERQFEKGEVDRIALLTAKSDYQAMLLTQLDTLTTAQQALGLLEDAIQHPLDATRGVPLAPEESPRIVEKRTL